MRNNLKPLFAALLLLLGDAAAESTTADILTRIEAETLVLKAREKQLIVQGAIVAKQAEIASKQAEVNRLVRPGTLGDPTVLALEGIGGVFYATLQLENGSTLDVKAGDVMPNGMVVISIRGNEVIVAADKRRIRLATGGAGSSVAASPVAVSSGNARQPFSLPPTLPFAPPKETSK